MSTYKLEFDREIFSLYLLMASMVFGSIFFGYKYFYVSKMAKSNDNLVNEKSTSNPKTIDYQWLPKETLRLLSKFVLFIMLGGGGDEGVF